MHAGGTSRQLRPHILLPHLSGHQGAPVVMGQVPKSIHIQLHDGRRKLLQASGLLLAGASRCYCHSCTCCCCCVKVSKPAQNRPRALQGPYSRSVRSSVHSISMSCPFGFTKAAKAETAGQEEDQQQQHDDVAPAPDAVHKATCPLGFGSNPKASASSLVQALSSLVMRSGSAAGQVCGKQLKSMATQRHGSPSAWW